MITWYRQNVTLTGEGIHTSNGTLTLNVTENDGASRVGVLYHCRATNTLGPKGATITATIRSQKARVAMHVSYLLITVVHDVMYLLDGTACLYNSNY